MKSLRPTVNADNRSRKSCFIAPGADFIAKIYFRGQMVFGYAYELQFYASVSIKPTVGAVVKKICTWLTIVSCADELYFSFRFEPKLATPTR